MPSKSSKFSWSHSIFLLILVAFPPHVSVVDGFFVKSCDIKGSLKYPENIKALCGKKNLNAFPKNLPNSSRVLDVSHNKISKIKFSDLKYLSYLTHLNGSYNVINEVEDGAFSRLLALQELNLAFNRLTTIQEGFFQNLFNLTVLRLNENLIKSIKPSVFDPLTSLIMVNLSRNQLHNFQELQSLFALPSLSYVYVASNGFTTFQTWDVSNTSLNLKGLDLSSNPLQVFRITADIVPHLEFVDLAFINESLKWDVENKNYLQNVKRLNLSGIHMLTENIALVLQMVNSSLVNVRLGNLGLVKAKSLIKFACMSSSLTVLRLPVNNLSFLTDQEFKPCKQLTTLDLSRNNITNISRLAFSALEKIGTLSLCFNKLKSVPIAIGNLSTLEILDLSYNSITILGCLDFANLTNLIKLHMYRNPLFSLEPCAFQNLNNLKELIIGSNIMTIKVFNKIRLKNLQMLDLAKNKLNIIHYRSFGFLQSLEFLFLGDNQIQAIEPGAFYGLSNLIFLDLQSNKITQLSINASVFSGLPRLQHLFMNNNYISYTCQMDLDKPPFANLKSLASLSIHSQAREGMGNVPSNLFKGLTSLEVLWAGSIKIKSLHPQTFVYTPMLKFLDLSKNEFISMSPTVFRPLKQLYRLVMIQCGLQSLDFLMQANLKKIKMLFARQNEIAVMNVKTVIEFLSNLTYLDLEKNGFMCDCTNVWFINWTINGDHTQVINADTFKCNYPSNLRGTRLLDLDVKSCNVDGSFIYFVSTFSLVFLTLLWSFLYHFLKWQVAYTYYVFLAFLYDSKQRKQKTNDFQYDAFISYNTHDELWVMKELLPKLEGEQGWKLCLHHRDFQPGKPIVDNIVDGIYSSRKTICVISRHYLESEWCSREIQVASFRLFDEKYDVLILLFLEDIPPYQLSPFYRMRRLIKKHTYITWPKLRKDTHLFWQKLRVALGTKKKLDL